METEKTFNDCIKEFESLEIDTFGEARYQQGLYDAYCQAKKFIKEKMVQNKDNESMEAFKLLIKLRDKVRDGWKPDFKNAKCHKYSIIFFENKWHVEESVYPSMFSFNNFSDASLFLSENIMLFEKIKNIY